MSDFVTGINDAIPRFAIVRCDLNYKAFEWKSLGPAIRFLNNNGHIHSVKNETEIAEVWGPVIVEAELHQKDDGKMTSVSSVVDAGESPSLHECVIYEGTTQALFTDNGLRLTASSGRSTFGSLAKGETAIVIAFDYADVDVVSVERHGRQYCDVDLHRRNPRMTFRMRVGSYTTDGSRTEPRLVKNADVRPLLDLLGRAARQQIRTADPSGANDDRRVADWISKDDSDDVPSIPTSDSVDLELFTKRS